MSCLESQTHFPSRAARWGAPGALFSGHFILVDSHICARVQVLKKIYKSETIELIELKPSLLCTHMSCLEPQTHFPPGPAHGGAPGALFSRHLISAWYHGSSFEKNL